MHISYILEKPKKLKMKAFLCLALIVACNVALNQAAAIDQDQSSLKFVPIQLEEDFENSFDDHSRQRRETKSSNTANVDVQRNRGTTSVNAQVGRQWELNNGRTKVEVNGNYGRDYGRHGSKPSYGGSAKIQW